MIAEAGLAAIWLAAALALLQTLAGFGAIPARDKSVVIRAVAVTLGALTLFAMLMLVLVFLRTDLSVLLVAENSHSAKPWLYKLAGAWAWRCGCSPPPAGPKGRCAGRPAPASALRTGSALSLIHI